MSQILKTEHLYQAAGYTGNKIDSPPENVTELQAYLTNALSLVPDEYKHTLAFEIVSYYPPYCETASAGANIYYFRNETQEEKDVRETKDRTAADRRNAERKAEYLKLKKEFEGT